MATRSTIGISNNDGSVDWTYIHFDGDIVGGWLAHLFRTREAVRQLITGGPLWSVPKAGSPPDPMKPAEREGVLRGTAPDAEAFLSASETLNATYAFLFDGVDWREVSSGLLFFVDEDTVRREFMVSE